LAAFAEPLLFYFANGVAHVALGIFVAFAGARYLFAHWNTTRSIWVRAAVGVLAAGMLVGLVVTITGATRPYRWILNAHIALATVGSVLLATALFVSTRRLAWFYPAFVVGLVVIAVVGRLEMNRRFE